ncbi:MAG TPA: tRNA pseudouridine(55) synthase TruB [Candidatus Olsenella pullicola]|nr:tRNA pseudouridine(55) synthase TruB [Candidatus Olsenella pullicola]
MSRRPSAFSALLAIDKPAGMTSHDVVSRVRRAVGERRVGHAGTLDPAATGVLVVGIGQATKLLGLLTLDRKGYRATFQLGSETTTDDAEGEVTRTAEVPEELLDLGSAKAEASLLEGEQDQVPPAFSAVSVNGRRAYDAARSGEVLELAARRVRVYDARVLGVNAEDASWELSLDVSKGTYVRSLARDLGRRLGCFAHVSTLRRTFSGPVTLADCVTLEELDARGAELVHERCLDPVGVLGLPERALGLDEIVDVMNGRKISLGQVRDDCVSRVPSPGERVALTLSGGLAGIWRREGRFLVCESNFPQAIEGVRAPLNLGEIGPEAPLDAHGARLLVRAAVPAGRAYRGGSGVRVLDGSARLVLDLPNKTIPFLFAVDEMGNQVTDPLLSEKCALGEDRRFVCAIGAFDGLHCGHRALLSRAHAEARRRGCRLAVVTFSPDPARVLSPKDAPKDLLSADDREYALIDSGIDALLVFSFTHELASVPYERFVREALGCLLDVRAIVVGEDFRLGARGKGTVSALRELGRSDGFDVIGVELSRAGGEPITATRIRGLVERGSVEEASALLGRCHFVEGEVERGRGEGTGFGFPTANVRVADGACLPAEGVYAGFVVVGHGLGTDHVGEVAYPAAINVGKPRTFSPGEEGEQFLEATLLGFEGILYDRVVRVVFVRWLREPRAFGSVEELERVVLSNVDWVRKTLGEKGVELSGRCG